MKDSLFYIIVIAIAIGAFFFLKKKESPEVTYSEEERSKDIEEMRLLLEKESAGDTLSSAEIERLKALVEKSKEGKADLEKAAAERAAEAARKAAEYEAEKKRLQEILDRHEKEASDYYNSIDQAGKDLEATLIQLEKEKELARIEKEKREAEAQMKAIQEAQIAAELALKKAEEDRLQALENQRIQREAEAAAERARIQNEQEWNHAWSTAAWIDETVRMMHSDLFPENRWMSWPHGFRGYVDDAVRQWLWNMNDKQLAIAQKFYRDYTGGRSAIEDIRNCSFDPPYREPNFWGTPTGGYRPDGSRFESEDMQNLRNQLVNRLYNIPLAP